MRLIEVQVAEGTPIDADASTDDQTIHLTRPTQ